MQRPFHEIINASKYRLKYVNAYDPFSIIKIIKDTAQQVNVNDIYISDADFDNMIKALTSGGMSSAIASRKEPGIITSLCTHFPTKITKKHIDKMIKCMDKKSYPKSCVDAISNIGHVFTKSQMKHLIASGYDMISDIGEMNYDEFLAFFNNVDYVNELRYALSAKYDESPHILNHKIKSMNDLRLKYNIKFDTKFIDIIVTKVFSNNFTLNSLFNVHLLAKNMEMDFDKNQFKNILRIILLRDLVSYYEESKCSDDQKCMLFKNICDYYGPSVIDRDLILDFCDKFSIIKLIIHPFLTDYNPLDDLFYMLTQISPLDTCEYLKHLLKLKYLNYDDFLLYLLSLGYDDNNATLLREYIGQNNKIHDDYLPFFYMFTNSSTLMILFDNKIMPMPENVLQCTKIEQLTYIKDTDVFMDDKNIKFIETITDKNYYESNIFFELSQEHFLELYYSLTKKDREIIIRIPIQNVLKLGTIIRYDIKLTKQYLTYLILYGYWRDILKLLCFTNKYDYLYSMFDIDMILHVPTMIARMWFLNNIYNSSLKLYKLSIPSNYHKLMKIPCNVFDLKLNLDIDMANLLKLNIINDVKTMHNNVIESKQAIRKSYILNK